MTWRVTDPAGRSRVGKGVRRFGVLISLVAAAGCGGGARKGPTTPQSSGTVAYEDAPAMPGMAPVPPVQPDEPPSGGPGPARPVPTDEPGPAGDAPAARQVPPGEDISSEQRSKLVQGHLGAGAKAVEARDAKTVIREAQSALALDGYNVDAMVLLAHGYYLDGNIEKAERVLDDTINDDPDTVADDETSQKARSKALVYMLYGLIYERTGREKQALAAYTMAVERDARYVNAWLNRGVLLLKQRKFDFTNEQGQRDGAIPSFERAIGLIVEQRKPDAQKLARTRMHLGSAYRGQANVDRDQRDDWLKKARREFDEAIRADPNYAPVYYNYGLLYLDATTFPGMDNLDRLAQGVQKLKKFRDLAQPGRDHPVHAILAKAEEEYQTAKALRDFEEQQKREEQGGGN